MPITSVDGWSTTANLNSDVNGNSIAENCSPAGINNAMREMMAQIAATPLREDPEDMRTALSVYSQAESNALYIDDTARPVSAGGTGSTTADGALVNLGGGTAGIDAFKAGTQYELQSIVGIGGNARNLASYGAGVGTGDANADTTAFLAAAVDLVAENITVLELPAADIILNQQVDINSPSGRISIIGQGRNATRIITRVNTGTVTQKQYPFVIRNTTHGTEVRGIAFEADADSVSYYQNPLTFCNVSNLILQDFISENSDQYGLGIFDDVVAAPASRTATACDNLIVRNGIIKSASQYGIQHFPKVPSSGLHIEDIQTINCGSDVQGLGDFEPAGIKCGQTTRGTVLNNVDVTCIGNAVGLAISNYEDYTARGVVIRNPIKQAVSISSSTHPNLVSRYPLTVGGATPSPYLPSHGLLDIEVIVEHSVSSAGKRSAAAISCQYGGTAKTDCATASDTNITLSGAQTVAGVSVGGSSERVLVTGQTTASQDGIWVSGAGSWTRATDFDQTAEVVNGSVVNVTGGTNRGGWILISADPHTVGTTSQSWQRFNPAGGRIKATINGEVIEAGTYGGFVGSVHAAFGVNVPNINWEINWTAGDPRGLSGTPGVPFSVAYLVAAGGRAVNPTLKITAKNPYRIAQTTFMALWLSGQDGADVEITGQGMGTYVFRGDNNTGSVVFNKFDVQDFNLTNDAAQAAITISGSTGNYHFVNPIYRETSGVGNGDYWILGGGTAPVYISGQRSNVTLLMSVNPMIIHQLGGRSGTATLSAGTVAVSFALSEPDTNYHISLAGAANETFRYSSKATTGFTITSSNAGSTATVDWTIKRA